MQRMWRGARIARVAAAALLLAVAIIAAAIFFAVRPHLPRPPGPAPVWLSLELPRDVVRLQAMRLSPDGRYLALNAGARRPDSTIVNQLWIQPLDGSPARSLPGTESGGIPFWSPDSRSLGFVPGEEVARIDISGGEPVPICAGIGALDGSWGSSGTILVDTDDGIEAVSSSGGGHSPAAWPDTSRREAFCLNPVFLPDGRHFLYLSDSEDSKTQTLRVGTLGSRESKLLAVGQFSPVQYVPPGYIVYQKERTLYARPFDARRLRLTGETMPVLEDVLRFRWKHVAGSYTPFSASARALVYRDEQALPRQQMVWMDRVGRKLGSLGPAGRYQFGASLSPDGTRVAISYIPPGEVTPDIWVVDVERDLETRLTSDPDTEIWPIWSVDGTSIYYEDLTGRIWRKPASGIGEAKELPMPPGDCVPQVVSPDGHFLIAIFKAPDRGAELVKVSLDANPRTTSLGFNGYDPSFSPDGKWLAYGSGETGRGEVYVVDFPGITNKWRVSRDGGGFSRWSRDGREIFFVGRSGGLMSVPVSTTPTLQLGRPARLHASPMGRYDLSSDGRRFLVILETGTLSPTKVVLNWQTLLRR